MTSEELIRDARKTANITQAEMAKYLGVTQGRISAAENGQNRALLKREGAFLVRKYGKELGFEMSDFFPEEEGVTNEEIKEGIEKLKQGIEEIKRILKEKRD